MATSSLIELLDEAISPRVVITQLYPQVELYSEGDPALHTLFVLGRAQEPRGVALNELLLIDPPADAARRFRLEERTAAIFTGLPQKVGIAALHGLPGGLTHVRIGDHFLDVYTFRGRAAVHLPALGIICTGDMGSNRTVPAITPGSDGEVELDALRLLARLARSRAVRLFIPSMGEVMNDAVMCIERLADDVAYLHGLRRVVGPLVQRGESVQAALALAHTLLPGARRTPLCQEINRQNVRTLFTAGDAAQHPA